MDCPAHGPARAGCNQVSLRKMLFIPIQVFSILGWENNPFLLSRSLTSILDICTTALRYDWRCTYLFVSLAIRG